MPGARRSEHAESSLGRRRQGAGVRRRSSTARSGPAVRTVNRHRAPLPGRRSLRAAFALRIVRHLGDRGDGERRAGGRRRRRRDAGLSGRRDERAAPSTEITRVARTRAAPRARRTRSARAPRACRIDDGPGSVRRRAAIRSVCGARRVRGHDTLMLRNMAYASVSAASAGLLLILFIVAGRMLGDAEFGKFAFALALGTIFETLMDFGLHQVTIRAVARDQSRATVLLHHTLGIKLVWTMGALAALVTTATIFRSEWDVRIACYLLGGSLVLRSYMLTIRGVLQGLERFGWDSLVVVADRAILIAGVAALAAGGGIRGLAIAFVVARGIALALTAWMTHAHLGGIGIRFDREVWRELQTTALPLGFFLVVMNLYSYVDGVMLGVMRTDV